MSGEVIAYIESVDDQEVLALMVPELVKAAAEDYRFRPGQVGSYVVIPQDGCKLLALVTAQRTRQPERGPTDSVEPNLTTITMLMIGTVRDGRFHRGISHYPVVGEPIKLADDADLASIFTKSDHQSEQTQDSSDRCTDLPLGRFAPNENHEVKLDGKAFFAKHAAILGSSGSGKSCTVAQLIQQAIALPETQVILFDLHGEYFKAFSDDDGRPLSNVAYLSGQDLVLPYWLLKYKELEELFLDRSNPADVPSQTTFLKQALRRLRHEAAESLDLANIYTVDSPIYFSLEQLRCYANNLNTARFVLNTNRLAFRHTALRHLPPIEQEKLLFTSKVSFNRGNPEGEVPHPLFHSRLGGLINLLEQKMSDRRYDFMLKPIEQARKSLCFQSLFAQGDDPGSYSCCLEPLLALLTGHCEPRKNLVIIDLSHIPFETVDITVALLTRLLYEFNFWATRAERNPLLLVYEEAHSYISADDKKSFARRAVERVAKEGRKYSVGALVVSQRPVELSETVLSQCNSFIVMRISNPDDQAYVSKVVSEQFAGLVGTLAQLRPGEAYVIGEAVPMPMRTRIYLPERTPDSANADFLGYHPHWAGTKDIASVVHAWWRQERPTLPTPSPTDVPEPVAP
ncbi:MAG: DUF87 domain-containing protein [Actinobacteria bacterium]|nr:DUF87 domain-containing protein [Actinomycetota bacterium]